ncbi:MAG: putative toxin-antitoxin system toxin component, PIN family [Coriobacteriia bacterium]|nr:putative toxin-antitoxin system toxin component, PIN family [Coriobacteriia bacterium]
MRCLIDTNILISAALWPNSVPAQAFQKATLLPFDAIVSSYTIFELRDVFARKFSDKQDVLEAFIARLQGSVTIIEAKGTEVLDLSAPRLRDSKDEPILDCALKANADYLITGDKDFLEAALTHPRVLSPAEFLTLK